MAHTSSKTTKRNNYLLSVASFNSGHETIEFPTIFFRSGNADVVKDFVVEDGQRAF
jgi:hypothetical protein